MDYDYVGAKEAGMKPDADGKMGSIGLDGLILKMPEHPTYDETIKAEKKRGNIIIRIGNREYSVPPDYVQGEGEDLGKPTGGTTTGAIKDKQVYRYKGENVSEKSTTFKYKGKWINIPSIHNGKKYTDEQLRRMLDENLIKPTSVHDSEPEASKAAEERSNQTRVR